METINSIASGAAKLVWGENNTGADKANSTDTTTDTTNENQKPLTDRTVNKMSTETQGQEPVSGKLGDTSKGEPYDAGNIEPTSAQNQTPGVDASKQPLSESSGVTSTHDTSSTTTGSTGVTSEHPSTAGDQGGFKAAQADIRDPDTSTTTDPKVEAERKNVDDTAGLDDGSNPAKADGPGPKPIEEVARERGGDAANIGGDKKDDDPEGLGGKSEKKGTGEQYVKTSGLKADGGDFDATKPGAGKEADRLLEEKGIQNPSAAAAASKKDTPREASPSGSPDSKKDKPSLKEKIKAKLHKN